MIEFGTAINAGSLGKNTALQLFFNQLSSAKPFVKNETIGPEGNPPFNSLKELEGGAWLTSLELRDEKTGLNFEFVECILSVTQTKNIVTTALQGLDGTIKEFISDGDYQIQISAGVINGNGEQAYPIDQLTILIDLLKLKTALQIQSDFLDVFDITRLVVADYNLVQETHSNRQSLQISCLSDKVYKIELDV